MPVAPKFILLCVVALATPAVSLFAQADPGFAALVDEAGAAHEGYDFSKAVELFSEALDRCGDSLMRADLEKQLASSRNARTMSSYCTHPKVVAGKRFHLDDFFLYYPLPDRSWRASPNRLDSLGGRFSPAVYYPFGAEEMFWSAADTLGVRNIMYSKESSPGEWSEPETLPMSSSEDDIFPMVNGNRLYFASRGYYGVGGYDIYYCTRRSDGSWGPPRNMGFPYSSPADDFLFINSPDGKYSLFASNRDCPSDSVTVYVLEYEVMPVSKAVGSVQELRTLCRLTPDDNLKKVDNKSVMSSTAAADPNTALYMRKAAEVRALRDTIARFNRAIDDIRAQYAAASGEERDKLSVKIVVMENRLPGLQSRLVAANKELQKTEMDFFLHGVLIDRSKVEAEADNVVVGADKAYTFTRRRLGPGNF